MLNCTDEARNLTSFSDELNFQIFIKQKRKRKRKKLISIEVQNHRLQRRVNKLPKIFQNIKNKGIINLSDRNLSLFDESVLSLGLKFILKPKSIKDVDIENDLNNYFRNLRLKYQFADFNDSNQLIIASNKSYMKKIEDNLYIKNSLFMPNNAGYFVEQYINLVAEKLKLQLLSHPVKIKEKIPKMIKLTIDSLKKDSTIVIKNADKNYGLVIVNRTWYEQEALRQLNDNTTYEQVFSVPSIHDFYIQINKILVKHNMLFINANTELKKKTKLAKFILQFYEEKMNKCITKVAKFYMTIKVHKVPITGRPIVASMQLPTYFASVYLDRVLQPVMKYFKSYIKNSIDLIISLQTLNTLSKDCCLLTADVENMYPSIDIDDGLKVLRKALFKYKNDNKNFKNNFISNEEIKFIIDLAEWILKNNYFEFGLKTFFRQLKSTAMGTPFAVTFACIYLSMMEIELNLILLHQYNVSAIFYKRYIDDIFAIFNNRIEAEIFMIAFNNIKKNQIVLKLTCIGDSVEFLDVVVFKGNRFADCNLLDSKIFQKPQCKYIYLPPSSYHRNSVFKSFVTTELRRYRLVCTNDDDFANIKNLFKQRLLDRGYELLFIEQLFCINLCRANIIANIVHKQIKNKQTNSNPLVFQTVLTPRHANIDLKTCLQYTEMLWSDQRSSRVLNSKQNHPILCFKRTKTLKDLLTTSSYKYEISNIKNKN